ncbi:uncharacterized protein LOC144902295 [Branchiostoma floridae x Branchiostoma belcheri]
MDLLIQRTPQEDLSSDNKPQYSFDEALNWVSRSCPDWNKADIRKTYMIPPTFPDINKKDERGQLSEKHVFDILEEFGNKTEQSMLIVHSHKFSELIQTFEKGVVKKFNWYWRHGETDFVIIHRTLGVIFFQVKAGIRTWNRYGPATKQLGNDMEAMTRSLKRLCLEERGTTVDAELEKCQGFVVMPNCPRDNAQGKDGCFREDIQSVADFEKWWQKNVHRTGRVPEFSEEMYKLMATRFVGPRVITESCQLKDVIDKTHKTIIKIWTKDQLSIMTQNEQKQYIAGPAGSGKTMLLLDKAQEVAGNLKDNERILIMCFNKPLSLYLDTMVNNFPNAEQVVVRTFVSQLKKIKGSDWKGLPKKESEKLELVSDCVQKLDLMQSNSDLGMRNSYKYEHVFVDEGQDMYGRWVDLVKLLHDDVVGSNEERRYRWVFFDSNQSVHFGSQNSLPQEIIDSAKPMNRIVRNTRNIFECSQKFLSPEVQRAAELDHSIVGKQVKWIDSLPTVTHQVSPSDVLRKGAELVIQEIVDLESESVQRSDIVVLTKDVVERNEVCEKLELYRDEFNILIQDAQEAILSPNTSAIIVDSIRRFKGLERKVVILFDPPIDEEGSVKRDLNYVAMSRCFCYLVIVTSQDKKQKYDEKFAPKESPSRKRKQKSGKFSQKKPRKETD